MNKQKTTSLSIDVVRTKVDPVNSFSKDNYDSLCDYLSQNFLSTKGYCIAYLDYKVLVGRYNKKPEFFHNEEFLPKYLQRFRLFNNEKELFIWRETPGCFCGRLRQDFQTSDSNIPAGVCEDDVVDALQVLWGTDSNSLNNGWSIIFEERGTSLTLPFGVLKINKSNRVMLKTRNYIQYNEAGQAGYCDCRFIKFVTSNEEGK